ncbi:HGGxSTG domain-containing protein [Methylotenera sp.]|uniref:HGGxSTG domain-containing protein n=1 Tax=Methylotenera sp. TaxID=2051956 RepID=UPI00345C3C25
MKNIIYPMHCAPRCGAKTRSGHPCKSPAIHGKARCRMHGGKSTGRPSTPSSKFRKAHLEDRRKFRAMLKQLKGLTDALKRN